MPAGSICLAEVSAVRLLSRERCHSLRPRNGVRRPGVRRIGSRYSQSRAEPTRMPRQIVRPAGIRAFGCLNGVSRPAFSPLSKGSQYAIGEASSSSHAAEALPAQRRRRRCRFSVVCVVSRDRQRPERLCDGPSSEHGVPAGRTQAGPSSAPRPPLPRSASRGPPIAPASRASEGSATPVRPNRA